MVDRPQAIRDEVRQRADSASDARLRWWREARFGLFIHWGLYAVPAGIWQGQEIPGIGEWIMYRARIPVAEYEQLAAQFNPVRFDAAEWVSLAKRAGQRYIVITAKHHDGFCMYHTHMSPYNIVDATPFRRDPIAELAHECARQDIKLCFYYSQTQDWHHPDGDGNDWDYDEGGKDFDGYIEHYVKAQVRELLTQYGPIGLIWFDTPKRITVEQSRSLLELVHEIQPECLVSGRIGNALGDYGEAGDNRIPETAVEADWETPATINDTWGYKSTDQNWKSSAEMLHKLVDIVSKNGNYLLNVGPTAEGVIPEPSVTRLEEMGRWLALHGESIYGSKPGPIQGLAWCRSTLKGNRLFLHVFDWPTAGQIELEGLPQAKKAYLLADPESPLPLTQSGSKATISGPAQAPDAVDSVVVLDLAP
ncbi:MAG: alpha-L-fucosidase [Anaerolineae bacterium]|nr:alpha-L-fucosidase [Anaerolineae bacterium]